LKGVIVKRKIETKSVGNLIEALLVVADKVTVRKTEGFVGCVYEVEVTFYTGPLCDVEIIESGKGMEELKEIKDVLEIVDVEEDGTQLDIILEEPKIESKEEQAKESDKTGEHEWVVFGKYSYRVLDGRVEFRYGETASALSYAKAKAIFDDLPDIADTNAVIKVAEKHGVTLNRLMALALMRAFGHVAFGAEFVGGGRGKRAKVVKCDESSFLRDENSRKVAVEREVIGMGTE